jgi:hypothetical protein
MSEESDGYVRAIARLFGDRGTLKDLGATRLQCARPSFLDDRDSILDEVDRGLALLR